MTKKQQTHQNDEPRERHFEWYNGMSDAVLNELRKWYIKYKMVLEGKQGVPPNEIVSRKVIQTGSDDDSKVQRITRFKQMLGLSLNQIQWLAKTINEEDPRTAPAKALKKAAEEYTEYVKNNPQHTGVRGKQYDFSFEEVQYVYRVLECIKFGRLTPGQQKDQAALQSKQIEKADW